MLPLRATVAHSSGSLVMHGQAEPPLPVVLEEKSNVHSLAFNLWEGARVRGWDQERYVCCAGRMDCSSSGA